MRHAALIGTVAMVAVMAAGCKRASVRSEVAGDGVAYYLPKRLLKVSYARTQPATSAARQFANAQAAAAASAKAQAEAKGEFETAEAQRRAAEPGSAAAAKLEQEAAYRMVLLKLATQAHGAAQTELASASEALLAERGASSAEARDLTHQLADRLAGLRESTAKVGELETALAQIRSKRANAAPGSPEDTALGEQQAGAERRLAEAIGDQSSRQNEVNTAGDALLARIDGDAKGCKLQERIEIAATAPVPDPSKHFVATIDHSIWRRDQITLTTSKDGLLTNSSATLTDESNAILVALASSINALRSPPGVLNFQPQPEPPKPPVCNPASFELTIDPARLVDADMALKGAGSQLRLSWAQGDHGAPAPEIHRSRDRENQTCGRSDATDCGLHYRRDLTHLLQVRNNGKLVGSIPVALPNFSPVERIRLDATSFATNVHTLTFEQGMLTQAVTDQPSELLAIAKLPTNIIAGVLSSVATLVQLRVNIDTQNTALANQERALACALDRLEAARNGTPTQLPAALCP